MDAQVVPQQIHDGIVFGGLLRVVQYRLPGIGHGSIDGAFHRIGSDTTAGDTHETFRRKTDEPSRHIEQVGRLGPHENLLQRQPRNDRSTYRQIGQKRIAAQQTAAHRSETTGIFGELHRPRLQQRRTAPALPGHALSVADPVHREADRAASQRILGKETLRHLEIHGKEERPAPGTAAVHQLPDTPGIEETRHTQSLRKLASMAPPQGVMTDSGWNCTPCTSYTRWESAITVPSPSRAVTSRQSGIPSPSTIHE